jgi:hypothetical protein
MSYRSENAQIKRWGEILLCKETELLLDFSQHSLINSQSRMPGSPKTALNYVPSWGDGRRSLWLLCMACADRGPCAHLLEPSSRLCGVYSFTVGTLHPSPKKRSLCDVPSLTTNSEPSGGLTDINDKLSNGYVNYVSVWFRVIHRPRRFYHCHLCPFFAKMQNWSPPVLSREVQLHEAFHGVHASC